MVTLGDLGSILGAAAVIVGASIGLFQLRNFLQLRQIDVVIRLYSTFGDDSFQRCYWRVQRWNYQTFEDFDKNASQDDYEAWFRVSVFFENMGLLYKRGLAKIELLDDLLSGPILLSWEKVKPITIGYRKKNNLKQIAEWHEYLYDAMKERLIALGELKPEN